MCEQRQHRDVKHKYNTALAFFSTHVVKTNVVTIYTLTVGLYTWQGLIDNITTLLPLYTRISFSTKPLCNEKKIAVYKKKECVKLR